MNVPEIRGFDVIEMIGEGGMATVWKARQVSLDRVVAIKILHSRMADDSGDAERFQAEARAAAKLKHPGIVQVHDAGTDKERVYFVMEYVAGYTVGDWIRRKGRLSEDEALVVAECVADALNYAWTTAGIIHCDIKPDNIIIDADGTVKVADLGLARTINTIGSAGVADEVMGTPAYISPEQAEGKLDLDCRSDIYSLGAMVYHMVTGKLMFEGRPEEEVMELQVTSEPVDPKELNPDLGPGMLSLLTAMLSKDPALRPADWNAVAAQLARVRAQLTATERGQAPVKKIRIDHERLAKMASRIDAGRRRDASRTSWLVAALVVAALLVLIVARRGGAPSGRVTAPKAKASMPAGSPAVPVPVTPEPPPADPPAASAEDDGLSSAPADEAGSAEDPPSGAAADAVREADTAREADAAEMLAFVRSWAEEHPEQLREAIRRFARVAEDTRGTKYALMAEDEIQELEARLRVAKAEVMEALAEQVKAAVEAGDLLQAAQIYESYEGPLGDETRGERIAAADAMRKRHRELRLEASFAENRSHRKMRLVLRELADRLLADGVSPALDLCDEFSQDPVLTPDREQLDAIRELLQKAAAVTQRILDSFRAQKGSEVTVEFIKGPQSLSIVDVQGDKVIGRREFRTGVGSASSEIVFSVNDLSPRERMSRMGSDEEPDVALVKGLMAYHSKAYTHARRFFELAGTPMAGQLLRHVELAENSGRRRPPDY